MAVTYAGALTYEATLALKETTAGHFDPKYAPYALKPYPYEGGGVYMTYTPIIPPAPTFDLWFQWKSVRTGPFGGAGDAGGEVIRINDTNGERLFGVEIQPNYQYINLRLGNMSYLAGGIVTGFFPQGELITYTVNIKQDGVNHTLAFYVNGILQHKYSNPDTRKLNASTLRFANPYSRNGTWQWSISEMMMTDGEPLLGARLATLTPVYDATENTWDGTWQSLADEDTGSGISTDMLNARIAGDFSDYLGADSPIGIRALVQSMRYVDNNSGLRIQGYLRKDGVNKDQFDQTTRDESRVITIWDQNPYTNLDWEVGDLDNVNGGVRSLAVL